MREDGFITFAINDLPIGIARRLRAALQSGAGVIFPEVLLSGHASDGGAFLVPDGRDLEKHVRRPAALLGLMRLEQEDGRRAERSLAGPMAMGLRDDAGVLGEFARHLMIAIVNVAARM